MILYEETKPSEDGSLPPWLVGAPDLQRRNAMDRRWWGIGSGAFVGEQPTAKWVGIGDGFRATLLRGFDPQAIAHVQSWCPVANVADLKGRVWKAPCMLSANGERQYSVAYGEDFTPQLSPEQEAVDKIARAVRAAITAANATADTEALGLPLEMACRATAAALSLVNHIPFAAFGALALVDDALIAGTLYSLSGKTPRLEV